jgi:hypothetical protein
MSHLRDIMQRLAAHQGGASSPTSPFPQAARDMEEYRQQLRGCTPAMLSYEWTWLHQHLEDLALCSAHPPMREAAGGSQRVQQLMEQARTCLEDLQTECELRQLTPVRQPRSVATGEHAWDVSNPAIRSCWGLDAEAKRPG